MRLRVAVVLMFVTMAVGVAVGVVAARLTTWDPFALSTHQLDVIRTLVGVLAGIGAFLTVVNTIFAILARRWAKRAADQTSSTRWVEGSMRPATLAESVEAGINATHRVREEVTHFRNEWVRGNGTHRHDTVDIPRLEGSHYE